MITGGWRGPDWRVIDAHPSGARQVRRWIASVVARHECPVDQEDAALVADELFVNAVRHGPAGGRVLTGYCLWREGARIVVCDGGGPTTPRLHHADARAEDGRGLQLVEALAAQWGSFRLAGAQVVWCDFGQPLRVPASDAWAWLGPVLDECPLSMQGRAAGAGVPGGLAAAGAAR